MLVYKKIYRSYSCHVGVQEDRSFYGDLHEMSDKLTMLLIRVEPDKIPLLHKLKQLYNTYLWGVLINIAYIGLGTTCSHSSEVDP